MKMENFARIFNYLLLISIIHFAELVIKFLVSRISCIKTLLSRCVKFWINYIWKSNILWLHHRIRCNWSATLNALASFCFAFFYLSFVDECVVNRSFHFFSVFFRSFARANNELDSKNTNNLLFIGSLT